MTSTQGYDSRFVRYEQIHRVPETDFVTLAKAVQLKPGIAVGDLMAGYGAVTQTLYNTSIEMNCRGIEFYIIDAYREQLERARAEIPLNAHPKLCQSDVRSLTLADGTLDRAIIKMGLHEIPYKDQPQAVSEIYRVLKPGGRFIGWHMHLENRLEQDVFQRIIRVKDELAGLPSLVKNRYFFREDELISYLEQSAFENIRIMRLSDQVIDTMDRLGPEFNGERDLLDNWNDRIRKIAPKELHETFQYQDLGSHITFVVPRTLVIAERRG